MTSDTTPHTFQQEHYSTISKMEGNFIPVLMMAFGIAGIVMLFLNLN